MRVGPARRIGRRAALAVAGAVVAAMLSACTPAGALKPGLSGRPTPDAFDLYGKVAVRHDGDGSSGAVRWQRDGRRDAVDLYGPTGSLVAKIRRTPERATLDAADGKHYEAADAATLSQDVLGWELPLEPLRWWVFGLPAPTLAEAVVEPGPDGRASRITQGEWRVRLRDWQGAAGTPGVPARIDLERPGLAVRLLMSRWAEPQAALP